MIHDPFPKIPTGVKGEVFNVKCIVFQRGISFDNKRDTVFFDWMPLSLYIYIINNSWSNLLYSVLPCWCVCKLNGKMQDESKTKTQL